MIRSIASSIVAITLGCGCSDSGPRYYHVSGTVTYRGQPLSAGQIFFTADYTKGNDGMQGSAIIKEGRYDTRGTGKGVLGGAYRIRIDGFDGKPGNELPLGKPLFQKEFQRDLPKAVSTQGFEFN